MICGYCGKPFAEDRSQPACRQCPVGTGCGLVRCPHCGYENPGTPGWIAFLKRTLGLGSEGSVASAPDPAADPASDPAAGASPAGTAGLSLPMLRPRP